MRRRDFLMMGGAALAVGLRYAAAVAPTLLLAAPHEMADDGDDWKYYEAFGERLRRLLVEQDLEFKKAWLAPCKDGRRHVTVFFKNAPPVEFDQPWGAAQ